jgi:hypothetical protein
MSQQKTKWGERRREGGKERRRTEGVKEGERERERREKGREGKEKKRNRVVRGVQTGDGT